MFNLLISSHWHSTSHHSYLPCLLLSPFFSPLPLSVCGLLLSPHSLPTSSPYSVRRSQSVSLLPLNPCATSPCLCAFAGLLICYGVSPQSRNQTETSRERRHSESNFWNTARVVFTGCPCLDPTRSTVHSVPAEPKVWLASWYFVKLYVVKKQFENSHSSLMTKNLVYSRTCSYVLLLAPCQRERLQQAVRLLGAEVAQ